MTGQSPHKQNKPLWLPTTKKEIERLGWDHIDVILFSGDAYIPGEKVFFKLQNGNKEDAVNSRSLLKDLSKKHLLCPGHKR